MTNTNNNGWEVYTGGRAPRGGMEVSIYKSGQLSLTAEVQQALGSESVVLLFNRDRNQIGLRAARPGDGRAYKLRRPANQSTWLVNAAAFLKHYGLENLKGQRFPATAEGELIVVALGNAP
jgi:hypothetical protein